MSSKEEIIAAIGRCAEQLGHNPSFREVRQMANVPVKTVLRHFGSYTRALRAAGLEPRGGGHPIETANLLIDWAATARRLGKLPTVVEYDNDAAAQYSSGPYQKRFTRWAEIAPAFQHYAEVEQCQAEWADVLGMVDEQRKKREIEKTAAANRGQTKNGPAGARFLEGRPVYGTPVAPYGMMHEPVTEACVLFLFGMMAQKLGMVLVHAQNEFPDCVVMREVQPGKWQAWLVEVELRSRNFLQHGHDPKGCDMIVCWVHDWAECPEEIEVVELKTQIAKIAGIAKSED